MILVVCVDDNNGLMFNNRRVSSDKAVISDVISFCNSRKISVSPYSSSLFNGFESCIAVSNHCLDSQAEVCFAECGDFLQVKDSVDMLILYKWNRRYPSDLKFPVDLFISSMKLQSTQDFAGNSHPCITREVYVR